MKLFLADRKIGLTEGGGEECYFLNFLSEFILFYKCSIK